MNNMPAFPSRVDENTKEAELLIIETVARIQLSPTQVQQAEQNYHALADYIDGEGSPLEDRVETVHASGSFAIGAPIVGKLAETQHDVDAVLELVGFQDAGKSRYTGMVERNSRCVTVTYKDGRTVDLMPVHHITDKTDFRKKLFHYKEASAGKAEERYRKKVAPRGFKDWYLTEEEALHGAPLILNEQYMQASSRAFAKRQILMEKADTEKFPEQKSLPEKTARTLAVQLLKRHKDIQYMRLSGRKPPSVLIATLAMQSSRYIEPLLIDELINVASYLSHVFTANVRTGTILNVSNPWWNEDVISDRWNSVSDQNQYLTELNDLIIDLNTLKIEPRLSERKKILERNFGENVTVSVLKALEERRSLDRTRGATKISRTGGILVAKPSIAHAAEKKTQFGG